MESVIIEVPSPLGLSPSGVETAPDALRQVGLHRRLAPSEVIRIEVPTYSFHRDSHTQLLNQAAIATVAGRVADAVDAALDANRFPIVLGGDCSVLLGPLLGLRRRGRYGLVFIDGHADFLHPIEEPHGQVASLDLALATGRGPEILANLEGLGPLVRDEDVALAGFRAFGDNDHYLGVHIRDTAISVSDYREIRQVGIEAVAAKVLTRVSQPHLEGFWVHLDVDVVDDDLMPAVDYRSPGGLSWHETEAILRAALSASGARGFQMTIFNPRLDPTGRLAERLSDLIVAAFPLRWKPLEDHATSKE